MIEVRAAQEHDVEAIAHIYTVGWRDTYTGIHSEAYIEHIIAKYADPDRLLNEIRHHPDWDGWLVAERDGQLLGAGGGGLTSPQTWEIFVLYLNPTFRRQGVGSALVQAMTRQAVQSGASEQWVSATKANEKGVPFYAALGFEVQEERASEYVPTGEIIRTLRMKRAIHPSSLVE